MGGKQHCSQAEDSAPLEKLCDLVRITAVGADSHLHTHQPHPSLSGKALLHAPLPIDHQAPLPTPVNKPAGPHSRSQAAPVQAWVTVWPPSGGPASTFSFPSSPPPLKALERPPGAVRTSLGLLHGVYKVLLLSSTYAPKVLPEEARPHYRSLSSANASHLQASAHTIFLTSNTFSTSRKELTNSY